MARTMHIRCRKAATPRCWWRNASARGHASAAAVGAVGVGARVVEEGVAGARIDADLVGLAASRSRIARSSSTSASGMMRVLGAEQAEIRAAQLRRELERAGRLGGGLLGVAQHAVPADAGGEAVDAAGGHQRVLAAHAEAGDADAVGAHVRPRRRGSAPRRRGRRARAGRAARAIQRNTAAMSGRSGAPSRL